MNSMSRWIYRPFRSGDYQQVVDDLRIVRRTAGDRVVKAIYYSAVLTDQESIKRLPG